MQVGIIADDLTGASDATAPFRRRGLEAVVLFDWPPSRVSPPPAAVVTLDTESRHGTADEAQMRQRAAAQYLNSLSKNPGGPPVLYKKIDSTLRGHIGAELKALLEMYPERMALLTPAFPANGRTVEQGFLKLHGQRLDANSAQSGNVLDLIKASLGETCILLGLAEIREGVQVLSARLEALRRAGVRTVACDALEEADLDTLAKVLLQKPEDFIAVGSAGLASAIANRLEPREVGPVLLVNGSLNAVSQRQVEYLAKYGKVEQVELGLNWLSTHDEAAAQVEVSRCVEQAHNALAAGIDTIITTQPPAVAQPNRPNQIEPEVQAEAVAGALGDLVESIFAAQAIQKFPLAGLVIVGGHTAINICRKLGAHGLIAQGEVMPGIAAARLSGGTYEGFALVSKAGGFGPEKTLAECVRYLRRGLT
jgi:uncharacterized protein YgbK (DUF1537 family)